MRSKTGITAVLIFSLLLVPHVAWSSFVDDAMLSELKSRYGERAYHRGIKLMDLIAKLKTADTKTKLVKVNDFFNTYAYRSDEELWKQSDYWATPTEFIGRAGGDCEDYVISKYFVLRSLDIPEDKLHLAYVKTSQYDSQHMVVNYFETPKSTPLVLDNHVPQLLSASQRADLKQVYSFPVKCEYNSGSQRLSCEAHNEDAVLRW